MEMPTTPTGMPPSTTTTIYNVTYTDYVLVGSDAKVEPVETARPRVCFTAWFAVGDSKETEIIDGIAPVDGGRLHIDAKGWLHIYVVKRGVE